MQQPIFSIQVIHLGRYADGRPNNQSILITDINYDLDVAATRMPRYLPAGGTLDLPLTSRVMGSYVQGDISKLVAAGMVQVKVISPGRGLGNTIVVDKSSTSSQENGTWDFPYKTIQRGVNALWGASDDPTPAPATTASSRKTLAIMTGVYDEDVVLPAAGSVTLLTWGIVALGSALSPRNLTRFVDPTVTPDPPGTSTVTSLEGVYGAAPSLGAFIIYGNIILGNINGARSQNFIMESVILNGAFNAVAQTSIMSLALANCMFTGPTFNAPTAYLVPSRCRWLASTPIFNRFNTNFLSELEFAAGFNVAVTPTANQVLMNSRIAGTVTCPGNFQVDYFTNKTITLNAVVKAGGWVNTIPYGEPAAY